MTTNGKDQELEQPVKLGITVGVWRIEADNSDIVLTSEEGYKLRVSPQHGNFAELDTPTWKGVLGYNCIWGLYSKVDKVSKKDVDFWKLEDKGDENDE